MALSKQDILSLTSLVPGSTIDLQIATPTAPKRVKTLYVGTDIPNCMIFQIPNNPKWTVVRDLLTSGTEIVVRYVLEGDAGQIIAFRVKVAKVISKPCGLLITHFPDSVQTLGLRAEKRAQPGIAVQVKADGFPEDSEVTGIIVDVSSKGCRIALPIKPDWPILDNDKAVQFEYHMGKTSIIIDGIIKNKSSELSYLYYGVQFKENQASVQKLLERHILIG